VRWTEYGLVRSVNIKQGMPQEQLRAVQSERESLPYWDDISGLVKQM
jgi:hypothetical protein